ncbi:MAG TPA: ABC transporter substrate-binding protein [Candidatus Binatia bacterium]
MPLLITALLPRASPRKRKNLCTSSSSASPWNNQLPFRIAIAKGFLKDQGLTVEQIFVRGGPTAIAALVSGNVEFASIGGAQAPVRSNVRGLDLQIIASSSNHTNYALLGSKEAKNVEELRGKIVGVTGAGAFSEIAIRIFLRETTSIPTMTSPCGRSAEPHCGPSRSKEASSPPRRLPPRIPSGCSTRVYR